MRTGRGHLCTEVSASKGTTVRYACVISLQRAERVLSMAAVRILTFNVFFEPVAMAVRMQAIGSLIEKYRPAVVGFQEITRESLKMLRAQV